MHHDGSTSARARAARIRAAHDYEANELDAMRRRTSAAESRTSVRLATVTDRLDALWARLSGRGAATGDATLRDDSPVTRQAREQRLP